MLRVRLNSPRTGTLSRGNDRKSDQSGFVWNTLFSVATILAPQSFPMASGEWFVFHYNLIYGELGTLAHPSSVERASLLLGPKPRRLSGRPQPDVWPHTASAAGTVSQLMIWSVIYQSQGLFHVRSNTEFVQRSVELVFNAPYGGQDKKFKHLSVVRCPTKD